MNTMSHHHDDLGNELGQFPKLEELRARYPLPTQGEGDMPEALFENIRAKVATQLFAQPEAAQANKKRRLWPWYVSGAVAASVALFLWLSPGPEPLEYPAMDALNEQEMMVMDEMDVYELELYTADGLVDHVEAENLLMEGDDIEYLYLNI